MIFTEIFGRTGARYQYHKYGAQRCIFFKEACTLGDRDSAQMAQRSTNMEERDITSPLCIGSSLILNLRNPELILKNILRS